MQYAIIGAGGTGGVMGYFMTKAGKDVTLIARGRHLEAMKEHGLTLERLWDPNPETIAVKATDMEHYEEQPSAIVLTVGSVVTSPLSRETCRQFAPAGSTPITLMFGFSSFASVETPVASPPPPIGTRI